MKVSAFGEILYRYKCENGLRFEQSRRYDVSVAGAEANTCVLLSKLGIPAAIISALPNNDLAKFAINQLKQYDLDLSHVLKQGEKMGVYYVEDGNNIRQSEVIYDRKNTAFSELKKGQIDWSTVLKDSTLFHWTGIAAAISKSAMEACQEGIETAQKLQIPISCDFNYRRKLWYFGQHPSEFMPEMLKPVNIVVADFDALEVYLNIKTDVATNFESRFKEAHQQLLKCLPHLQHFAMTFRKPIDNNLYYFGGMVSGERYCFSKEYALINVKDPIGAGDAFMAGVLYGILNLMDTQLNIDTAITCGVLKQSIVGDWALISQSEINEFLKNGMTSRIKR
jgi:2-dehydro-3-deoxygluconokinase